jgi:hypothetical protein
VLVVGLDEAKIPVRTFAYGSSVIPIIMVPLTLIVVGPATLTVADAVASGINWWKGRSRSTSGAQPVPVGHQLALAA